MNLNSFRFRCPECGKSVTLNQEIIDLVNRYRAAKGGSSGSIRQIEVHRETILRVNANYNHDKRVEACRKAWETRRAKQGREKGK